MTTIEQREAASIAKDMEEIEQREMEDAALDALRAEVAQIKREFEAATLGARKKITQARVNLGFDHPFFGFLSYKFDPVPDASIPWFATDGKRLYFNPMTVENMPVIEVEGCIAHEAMHCSNGHVWRQEGREHDRWNRACDEAINWMILAAGLKLPAGILNTPAYNGKSAEWIYTRIEPSAAGPQGGCFGGVSSGQPGTGAPGQPQPQTGPGKDATGQPTASKQPSWADIGQIKTAPKADGIGGKEDWEIATLHAAQMADAMGRLPAGLDITLERIKHPAQNWRALTLRFMQQLAADDYTFKRPNRRYIASGMYLPSLYSENLGPVVIFTDTSGSMYGPPLQVVTAELHSIIEQTRPSIVYHGYCDAAIFGEVREFLPDDVIEDKPGGGGGTSFVPAFDWIRDNDIQPACLIYLTDMEGSFPAQAPDYPVLWAATKRGKTAPFGTIVELGDE